MVLSLVTIAMHIGFTRAAQASRNHRQVRKVQQESTKFWPFTIIKYETGLHFCSGLKAEVHFCPQGRGFLKHAILPIEFYRQILLVRTTSVCFDTLHTA